MPSSVFRLTWFDLPFVQQFAKPHVRAGGEAPVELNKLLLSCIRLLRRLRCLLNELSALYQLLDLKLGDVLSLLHLPGVRLAAEGNECVLELLEVESACVGWGRAGVETWQV